MKLPKTAKQIPGYPRYYITPKGEVYSTCRPNLIRLTPRRNADNYLEVGLAVNLRSKMKRIHKLLALTFLGEPLTSKHEVRHLDGNPKNNKLSNLAWGTTQENAQDSIKHGTRCRGEQMHGAKLTRKQVHAIVKECRKGKTHRELAVKYKVNHSSIGFILTGKTWSWLTGITEKELGND